MISKQPFGRTAHPSTRLIFGGFALSECTQAEADEILDLLLQYGINHIDTAPTYGESELRIGPWMEKHRQHFFLATKTGERTYQAAHDEIRRSLERLRVDQVDLMQLHFLVDPQEWEIAMGPGGALEAVIEAREQGLTRYIGITGHGTTVAAQHLRALERFDFDSVLLPYNYTMMQDEEYAPDFEALLKVCREKNVAVQTIKSIARGAWGDQTRHAITWYEPLTEQTSIDKAIHWALARQQVFVISSGAPNLLPKILDAANRFESGPSDEEMAAETESAGIQPLFPEQ